MRALVEIGEHHLQQPEFIQANCERVRKGIHNKRKLSSGSTEEATYTMLSMEQMRMVGLSSSVKYLAPKT
jgi:hypothetical protein